MCRRDLLGANRVRHGGGQLALDQHASWVATEDDTVATTSTTVVSPLDDMTVLASAISPRALPSLRH